jgi:hypothetical protein
MFAKMRYFLRKCVILAKSNNRSKPFSSLDNTTQPANLIYTIILTPCKRIPKDNEQRSILSFDILPRQNTRLHHCCETGTVGTVTFCRSGTGTVGNLVTDLSGTGTVNNYGYGTVICHAQ